jgi:hypothetical protein
MKKITKKDRVENYLEDLMKAEGFTTEDLMNMTVYDLFGNAELEGIGKTTLSGALTSFKQKYGLKKPGKGGLVPVKNTKKERVERYLTKLMKSPEFGVDDLMNLTVYDLFGNSELEGIGKTTLSSGISAFKKKYLKIQYSNESIDESLKNKLNSSEKDEIFEDETDGSGVSGNEKTLDDNEKPTLDILDGDTLLGEDGEDEEDDESFEDVFINVIVKEDQKEKGKTEEKETKDGAAVSKKSTGDNETTSLGNLHQDEIVILKKMVNRFKNGKMNIVSPENLELVELKHALRYFGVDYKTILEHYRKNADK